MSGSGKSDLAKTLSMLPDSIMLAADDYFINVEGEYDWDECFF